MSGSWEEYILHDFPDRAIRHLLENRRNLAELVAAVAPEVAARFDFDRAELLKRDFLLEDWRRRESDLLFHVPYRTEDGEADEALICILIEHQSTPDSRMPLRLLLYSALYWDREWKAWEKDHRSGDPFRIRPVIPIVFHTGTTPWEYDRHLADLFDGPELFKTFAPQWPVLFWDLAAHSVDELVTSAGDWLKALAVIRAEKEDVKTYEDVLLKVVTGLEELANRDHVRWHDLLSFIFGWIVQRRPTDEFEPLSRCVLSAESDRKHKQELSEMSTIVKGSFVDLALQVRRDDIITILEQRFGSVPSEIREKINAVEDAEHLKACLISVLSLESIDDLKL